MCTIGMYVVIILIRKTSAWTGRARFSVVYTLRIEKTIVCKIKCGYIHIIIQNHRS